MAKIILFLILLANAVLKLRMFFFLVGKQERKKRVRDGYMKEKSLEGWKNSVSLSLYPRLGFHVSI